MPEDWGTDRTVREICAYPGSAAHWEPIRGQVVRYSTLTGDQTAERMQSLTVLRGAIAAWRADQRASHWLSDLDKAKAAALLLLEALIQREATELAASARPVRDEGRA